MIDEAKLEEIAERMAGPHFYVDGDTWYSCGLAVEPGIDGEPGSGCADDSRRGRCDCGLAKKVESILAALQQARELGREEGSLKPMDDELLDAFDRGEARGREEERKMNEAAEAKLAEAQEKARLDFIAWCNSETERVEAEDARDRYAREANKLETEVERLRVALRDLLRDVDARLSLDSGFKGMGHNIATESAGRLRVDAEYARRVLLGEGEKP